MLKSIKEIKVVTYLEVIIEHPIVKNDEVTMIISKDSNEGKYYFSIPLYDWSYEKENGKDINLRYAPSGFNHPKYKNRFVNSMYEAIEIIEGYKKL